VIKTLARNESNFGEIREKIFGASSTDQAQPYISRPPLLPPRRQPYLFDLAHSVSLTGGGGQG